MLRMYSSGESSHAENHTEQEDHKHYEPSKQQRNDRGRIGWVLKRRG